MISCTIAWIKLGIACDWDWSRIVNTVKLLGYSIIILGLIYIGHRVPILGSAVGGLAHIVFGLPSGPADADEPPTKTDARDAALRPPPTGSVPGVIYLATGGCTYRWYRQQWIKERCDG